MEILQIPWTGELLGSVYAPLCYLTQQLIDLLAGKHKKMFDLPNTVVTTFEAVNLSIWLMQLSCLIPTPSFTVDDILP